MFVILKGKILNLKILHLCVCICVRIGPIGVCICDFGLGMTGQGLRGPDGAGLGVLKRLVY